MRISLRDPDGKETDHAIVSESQEAPAEALMLLARLGRINSGAVLVFDDDTPRQAPGTLMTVSAGNLRSLSTRMEARAAVIDREQPECAADLRMAARFCRHAVKVGWVITNVAVA
jgi:hypothetical protein